MTNDRLLQMQQQQQQQQHSEQTRRFNKNSNTNTVSTLTKRLVTATIILTALCAPFSSFPSFASLNHHDHRTSSDNDNAVAESFFTDMENGISRDYNNNAVSFSNSLSTFLRSSSSSSPLPSIHLNFVRFASALRVGVVGPGPSDSRQAPMNAVLDGLRLAFANQNKAGGIQGQPIELIFRDAALPGGPEAIVDELMANASTKLDVLATPPGETIINALHRAAQRHNLTIVGPSGGEPIDYTEYSMNKVLIVPKPDIEVAALIRYIVLQRNLKRIAVLTTHGLVFGNELLPYIKTLLAEFGLEMTFLFKFDTPGGNNTQLILDGLQTRPQAVLLLGQLIPTTFAGMLAIYKGMYAQGNDFVMGCLGVSYPMYVAIFPSYFAAGGRILPKSLITIGYTPMASDTRFEASKAFMRALAEFPTVAKYNPYFEPHQVIGFLIGTMMNNIFLSVDNSRPIDSNAIIDATFSGQIFPSYDYVFGPFSKPCTFARTISCGCNAGARHIDVAFLNNQFRVETMPNTRMDISLDSCIPKNEPIQSPLIQLVATPTAEATGNNTELVSTIQASVAQFLGGDSGAYINATTSPSSRTGIILKSPFTNLADLYSIQDNRLITVSTGSVFASHEILDTDVAGKTTVAIDPLFVVPPFHESFQNGGSRFVERVVSLSPTLEQEVHALTSFFGAFTAVTTEESMLEDFATYTMRSAHTFGVTSAGPLVRADNIAAGLRSFFPTATSSARAAGQNVFVHGIRTTADIHAINDYLGRTSSGNVLVPTMHLTLWYDALTTIVTDSSRRARVVFATSLPNWNPASDLDKSSPLMHSYYVAMKEKNLPHTPQTLRGYLTQRLVANIVERIPSRLTQESFLATLYAVSVLVLDSNVYTVGPLSNSKCSNFASLSAAAAAGIVCESNIGARQLTIRSLDASVSAVPSVASSRLDSYVFTSSKIEFRPLPGSEGMKGEIIAIIVCCVVVGVLIVALLASRLFTGRSHRNAPQDESEPFTIAFSDIQSSTSLWAEMPEEMGEMIDIHHKLIRSLIKKHNGYEVKTIGDAFMMAFKNADDAVRLAYDIQHIFFNCEEFSPLVDQAYVNFDREKVMSGELSDEALANLSCDLDPAVYKRLWRGIRVRVGINTDYGTIQKDEMTQAYDYYGTVTNTAARVEAVCHGGQVCFTEGTLKALEKLNMNVCSIDEINAGFAQIVHNSSAVTASTADAWPTRCARLGPVELRGLSNPITMYQLECVVGRKFPSLRLEKAGADDDFNGADGTCTSVSTPTVHTTVAGGTKSENSGNQNTTTKSAKGLATQSMGGRSHDEFEPDATAAAFLPNLEVQSSHLLVAIATLFSRLPSAEKKLKEYKRLCDIWGIRVDRKHIERVKTWATAGSVDEEGVSRTVALHMAKNDASAAAHLDQLSRRLRNIISKNLQNALGSNPALVPLIHTHNNNIRNINQIQKDTLSVLKGPAIVTTSHGGRTHPTGFTETIPMNRKASTAASASDMKSNHNATSVVFLNDNADDAPHTITTPRSHLSLDN